MSNFSKREQIMLSLIVVMALGLAGLIYDRFFSPQPEIAFQLEDVPATPVMASTEEEPREPEEIIVYVTGAVKSPGVYSLKEGDRVVDALEIAGGALPEADLIRINLASRLQDEDKLYVVSQGEDLEGQDSPGLASSEDGKVNINTADKATLESLPGIGAVTSEKIIDFRQQEGPFKGIEDIMKVSGIGEKKFEQLKDKIKVR